MRKVSAFIEAMAVGISDDLKEHVAPDKLQFEVEKELERQMLAQLVSAINERNQAISYYTGDSVKQEAAKKKVLRFMGYVSEMYIVTNEVKGALMDGRQSINADFAVVS